jgi:hypothetical protein
MSPIDKDFTKRKTIELLKKVLNEYNVDINKSHPNHFESEAYYNYSYGLWEALYNQIFVKKDRETIDLMEMIERYEQSEPFVEGYKLGQHNTKAHILAWDGKRHIEEVDKILTKKFQEIRFKEKLDTNTT